MNTKVLAAFNEKPRHTHFVSQRPDEAVILLLRRHWVTNIPWLFVLALMVFAPLLLMFFSLLYRFWLPMAPQTQLTLLLVWYLVALGFGFQSFLSWYFNVFIITEVRLLDVDFHGVLFKDVSECPLGQIQDVTHRSGGIFQIFFDYGDVFVQTAASTPRFELLQVPRPAEVHDKITDLVERALVRGGRCQ